jgi:hypothetical protein
VCPRQSSYQGWDCPLPSEGGRAQSCRSLARPHPKHYNAHPDRRGKCSGCRLLRNRSLCGESGTLSRSSSTFSPRGRDAPYLLPKSDTGDYFCSSLLPVAPRHGCLFLSAICFCHHRVVCRHPQIPSCPEYAHTAVGGNRGSSRCGLWSK